MLDASETPQKSIFRFLLGILKPYWLHVTGIGIAMICAAAHISLVPYFMKLMIDNISGGAFFLPASMLIASEFLLIAAWRLHDYCFLKSLPMIKSTLISKFFYYISFHSKQYFADHQAGDISGKIIDFADRFEKMFEVCRDIFRQAGIILIAAVALFCIHLTFGVIILTWSALFILLTAHLSKKLLPQTERYAAKRNECTGNIVDAISNMTNVRFFSRHRFEHSRLGILLSELTRISETLKWGWFRVWLYMGLFYCVMLSSVIGSLIFLRAQEAVGGGTIAFVIFLSLAVIEPVWQLTEQIGELLESFGICKNAFELLTKPHHVRDIEGASELEVIKGNIEFKNVNFSYFQEHPLFEDLSVSIPSGERVGLVGLSGSGKSTFVNLLTRCYDLNSGSITIDGKRVDQVSQKSLNENISFIPQDPILFHRTLCENIRYGRPDATFEEVVCAAQQAHADEFIKEMPMRYDSLVGERGIKLSGGQRQRIAIARALLKGAPILVLDEATSALDSLTEQYIQNSLKTLMEGRTVVAIAHRLSTLMVMDRILVFDRGKIIEDGSHEKLLKKQGLYSKFWDAQVAGFLPTGPTFEKISVPV